jgi:hypothetical protein
MIEHPRSIGPSAAWIRAFARLVADDDFRLPECQCDGTAVASCTSSMAPVERVLSRLPGTYARAPTHAEELYDSAGDTETGVFYSDAERAIVSFLDHWQAGLFATVAIYAGEQRYREALALASMSVAASPSSGRASRWARHS